MIKHLLLFLLFAASPLTATAQSLTALQGEVVQIDRKVDDAAVTVTAFGKRWPVKADADGRATAWIGIDLQTTPGDYTVRWRTPAGWQATDRITVGKGEFRISHITVEKKMAVFDKETLARIRADQASLKKTYSASVEGNPDIRMEIMPTSGIISTPFGAQRYVNGEPRSPHSGIDIAAPEGTPVYSPLAGKVLLVSDMYLNGNTVVIGHGSGLVSIFCHLQQSGVQEGEWIAERTVIGSVGQSGRSTGPHLHWSIRFNEARVDPHAVLAVRNP